MDHSWTAEGQYQEIQYRWFKEKWNSLRVKAVRDGVEITQSSEAEFITEHFWGYTQLTGNKTSEYGVEHPRWQIYPVVDYKVDVDFNKIYGADFEFLTGATPKSIFLAEGSEIVVREGSLIE
jgi:uncharacterized protein